MDLHCDENVMDLHCDDDPDRRKRKRLRGNFRNRSMAASRYEFCDVCDRPAWYYLANSSSAGCSIARWTRLISWPAKFSGRVKPYGPLDLGYVSSRVESTSRAERGQCGDSRYDNDRFSKGDYTSVCSEREMRRRTVKNEEAFDYLAIKRCNFIKKYRNAEAHCKKKKI